MPFNSPSHASLATSARALPGAISPSVMPRTPTEFRPAKTRTSGTGKRTHWPAAVVSRMSWFSVQVSTETRLPAEQAAAPEAPQPQPVGWRSVFDGRSGRTVEVPVYRRDRLPPGSAFPGPAIVAEDETSAYVSANFAAHIDASGCIVMDRKDA